MRSSEALKRRPQTQVLSESHGTITSDSQSVRWGANASSLSCLKQILVQARKSSASQLSSSQPDPTRCSKGRPRLGPWA